MGSRDNVELAQTGDNFFQLRFVEDEVIVAAAVWVQIHRHARSSDRPRGRCTRCRKGEANDAGSQGQALFDMANLRPDRTGLPFVVFISQRGGARHDVR